LPATAPQAVANGRVKASPLAKKIAADKGINIASIVGSGPSGRVVAKDLDGATSGSGMGYARAVPSGEDRVIANSMMRKTIAKRLLAGKNEAPHFYLTVSADMTRMNDWRARLNKDADKTGVKVSVNDLVIMAVAKALVKHPDVNASWQGESIIEYGNVHVAMAVALPTGLVTPVIRHADQLQIRDIAHTSRDLATKAKDGKLANEDYSGGTFTISNLGMLGVEEFTAIINPPQAAILAVGATIPTPAVDAKGQVVVQPRMKMTMSCDHRVIDGAMGAQFLQTLVSYLEDPLNML
jgi:pyruvate dehydrogenase E2 component (dihydrolipoamide acetyltransferase)